MKKIIKLLSGSILITLILSAVVFVSNQNQNLKVYFFDVGQGDGILIRTPSHQNIVIDGGPDNSFIAKLGQALPFYDRTIDLMVLTHPHDDNLFGLVEVLKRYRVKQVLSTGVLHTTDAYLEWLSVIQDNKINFKTARAGQTFMFAEVSLRVIYPFNDLSQRPFDELNDSSVVTQLIYDQAKWLFMGDLEEAGEEEIMATSPVELKSNVLKVGHHGSETSSAEKFLRAVQASYAVISVGAENKFGHPSRRIIHRLERLGAQILRTDVLGDIVCISDGRQIWLK